MPKPCVKSTLLMDYFITRVFLELYGRRVSWKTKSCIYMIYSSINPRQLSHSFFSLQSRAVYSMLSLPRLRLASRTHYILKCTGLLVEDPRRSCSPGKNCSSKDFIKESLVCPLLQSHFSLPSLSLGHLFSVSSLFNIRRLLAVLWWSTCFHVLLLYIISLWNE